MYVLANIIGLYIHVFSVHSEINKQNVHTVLNANSIWSKPVNLLYLSVRCNLERLEARPSASKPN